MTFDGYLDRWTIQGSVLEVRISSGNLEDTPEGAVLYITVDTPAERQLLERRFNELEPYETEVFVQDPTTTKVTVEVEYQDPIILRGKHVRLRQTDFEAEDYARLAKLHHWSADHASDALDAINQRLSDVKSLLADQAQRVTEKAKGHKAGSTARKLYDQQLSFITRVIRKLDT